MSLVIHIETVEWTGDKQVPLTKVVPLGKGESLEIFGSIVSIVRRGSRERCWEADKNTTITIFDHGVRQFYTNVGHELKRVDS